MSMIISAPSDRTQDLLTAARQKLVTPDLPQVLRMSAFLRLTCLTLEESGAYTQLMQQLFEYPQWWLTCKVTPVGTLHSSNPNINRLLEPINHLHYPQILLLAA